MKIKIIAYFFLFGGLLTSCSSQGVEPPDQVTLQLKWVHQAQFAGYYTAEMQGYYEAENIEVTFKPGGVGVELFEDLENGTTHFSVVGADSLLMKASEGKPITAIATIFRLNPFVLVAFEESGISSPHDFIGRTVALSGGHDEIQYLAMLKSLDIDPSQINVVPYTYDDTPFLEGQIDVTVSFMAGSLLPLQKKAGDRTLNLIWPGDYGVHFYSDTIICTQDLFEDNQDLVLRFLRATLEGHQYAIENPEAAIDASMKYAVVQDREVQSAMHDASIPLVHTGNRPIGWMDIEAWQAMQDILLEQAIINTSIDLDKIIRPDLLEQIYENRY